MTLLESPLYEPTLTAALRARIDARYHIEELIRPEGDVPVGIQVLDMESESIIAYGLPNADVAIGFAAAVLLHEDDMAARRTIVLPNARGALEIRWTMDEDGGPILLMNDRGTFRQMAIWPDRLDEILKGLRGEGKVVLEQETGPIILGFFPAAGENHVVISLGPREQTPTITHVRKGDAEDIADLITLGRDYFKV